MQTAICLLAAVPMRKEPSHRSEMVSQILFGEYVVMGEEKNEFVFVTCQFDGYKGWVQAKQLTPANEKEILDTKTFTSAFATPVTKSGQLIYVPYGTPVYQQNGFAFTVAGCKMSYLLQPQQTWNADKLALSLPTVEAVIQPYLNVPYLWGGKSVFGTDCSGFVQQVFKLFGKKLLRDAYLQAEQGTVVASVKESRLGDLAFFQNEKGRVTHVGMVLEDGKIVHAAGQVRIDALDEQGIVNKETGERTHRMRSLRRMF